MVQGTNALLLLAIVWTLAHATWLLWPGQDGQAGAPVVSAAPRVAAARAERPLQAVADLSLFGSSQPLAVAGGSVDAPETNLNLTLRGVLAASSLLARAIISAGSGVDESYKIGDALPGGAVLDQVLPDRVILSRSGRLETLYLPKESGVGVEAAQSPPLARAGVPGFTGAAEAGRMPEMNADLGARLQDYRQRIITNPQEAFNLARMQPVMEDGKLKGYRLSPNKEKQLFRQIGLRPGDVVTSVNGLALGDPAAAAQLMTQISSATQLTLTVDRGGQQETLVVPFGR